MLISKSVLELLEQELENCSSWDDWDQGYKEGLRKAIKLIEDNCSYENISRHLNQTTEPTQD